MKYGKGNSLGTQQAIARYGKSARHPLCLAALDLRWLDEEVSRWIKEVVRAEELVSSTKQLRERAQMVIKQLRKERKEKANETSAHLREIDKLLLRVQARYQGVVKIYLLYHEQRQHPRARFKREYAAAIRTGDVRPLRALQRVRKRWNDKKAFLADSDCRALEILKMLRDKAIDQATAKEGRVADGWKPLGDPRGRYLIRLGKSFTQRERFSRVLSMRQGTGTRKKLDGLQAS